MVELIGSPQYAHPEEGGGHGRIGHDDMLMRSSCWGTVHSLHARAALVVVQEMMEPMMRKQSMLMEWQVDRHGHGAVQASTSRVGL